MFRLIYTHHPADYKTKNEIFRVFCGQSDDGRMLVETGS